MKLIHVILLIFFLTTGAGFSNMDSDRIYSEDSPSQGVEPSVLKNLFDEMRACLSAPVFSQDMKNKAKHVAGLIKELDLEMGYQAFHEVYKRGSEFDLLEESYEARVKDFPGTILYKIELAAFYGKMKKDYEKSSAVFEEVIADFPDLRVGYYMYGRTCAEAGYSLDSGISCLGRYLEFEDQLHPALAHYYLGELYRRKGHIETAEECYRTALKIDPECKPAQTALNVMK